MWLSIFISLNECYILPIEITFKNPYNVRIQHKLSMLQEKSNHLQRIDSVKYLFLNNITYLHNRMIH